MDRAAALEVVRTVLEGNGLSVEEALAELRQTGDSPVGGKTIAEYVPEALPALGAASTCRTWEPPLRVLAEGWSVPHEHLERVRELARDVGATWPDELVPTVRLPLSKADRDHQARPDSTPLPTDHVLVFAGFGATPVAAISERNLKECSKWIRIKARLRNELRANIRGEAERKVFYRHNGSAAVEHFISASRRLFALAQTEPDITIAANPAKNLKKPALGSNDRRPLTDQELSEAWDVICTSDDPELDTMIVRTLLGACARKGGVLALRLCDLDEGRSTAVLTEKGEKAREVPIPPSLMADLLRFAASRGATQPRDRVFRYRNGRPLTSRRWDYLFPRVQKALPWADAMPLTGHVLRHHAAASMERARGHAVAQRYLGHAQGNVTDGYVEATLEELAEGVQYLSGEPHPLAGPAKQL